MLTKILSAGVFQWGRRQWQTNNNFVLASSNCCESIMLGLIKMMLQTQNNCPFGVYCCNGFLYFFFSWFFRCQPGLREGELSRQVHLGSRTRFSQSAPRELSLGRACPGELQQGPTDTGTQYPVCNVITNVLLINVLLLHVIVIPSYIITNKCNIKLHFCKTN